MNRLTPEKQATVIAEVWSFCYAKQKNVPADKQGQFGYGDVWDMDSALCGYEADL
jgi:hypothetical protein